VNFPHWEELANAIYHILTGAGTCDYWSYPHAVLYFIKRQCLPGNYYGSIRIIHDHSLPLNLPLLTGLQAGARSGTFFFNLDQISIYLLIAGTYTPITLVAIKEYMLDHVRIEWGIAMGGFFTEYSNQTSTHEGVNYLM